MGIVACVYCARPFDLNLVRGPLSNDYKPTCFTCDPNQKVDLERGMGRPWATVRMLEEELEPVDECDNCGIVDKPLSGGFCEGCTCLKCKAGGTMNEAGWCDLCEGKLARGRT